MKNIVFNVKSYFLQRRLALLRIRLLGVVWPGVKAAFTAWSGPCSSWEWRGCVFAAGVTPPFRDRSAQGPPATGASAARSACLASGRSAVACKSRTMRGTSSRDGAARIAATSACAAASEGRVGPIERASLLRRICARQPSRFCTTDPS